MAEPGDQHSPEGVGAKGPTGALATGARTYLWLALLLTLPAVLPLAAPGYFFKAHDAHHSVFFLVEFDRAIRDGVLWPVWGPDHALGFGYPLWLLYAPLAYYVAEVFHLLGLGFTAAVKATWALGFAAGGLGMYLLARRWWGDRGGLIASLAYTYAPYHLTQIYVRAALAEFAALAVFPWVWLAFDALWQKPGARRAALAALALAALLLTHTVSALILVPLLAGFLLFKLVTQRTSLHWTAVGLILGGMLAAVFWLPMLLERGYIAESQWVQTTYSYHLHFVYPNQFFDTSWGFGYSVPGPNDGMSFQLGLLQFACAVLGTLVALQGGLRAGTDADPARRRALTWFLAAASLLALLAMTPAAGPIWDHLPLVSLIQFPWRLLAVTTVTAALLGAAAAPWLERPQAAEAPVPQGGPMSASESEAGNSTPGPLPLAPYPVILALAFVAVSAAFTQPELVPIRPQDESPIAIMEFELKHPDMRGMTRWSERPPENADSPLLDQYLAADPTAGSDIPLRRAAIVAGQGRILDQESRAASAFARVLADTDVRLRFYTYYFPGWRATVDGRPASLEADPPNGLIGLTLPPGEHEVRVRFGPTAVRQLAAGISLVALLVVVLLLWSGPTRQRFGRPVSSVLKSEQI